MTCITVNTILTFFFNIQNMVLLFQTTQKNKIKRYEKA